MTKTATSATRSNRSYVVGQVATKADLETVHEMQNYARTETVQNLLSVQAAAGGWGGGGEISPAADGIYWQPVASGAADVYRVHVWIDPEVESIAVRTRATQPASSTARVDINVGSGLTQHVYASASPAAIDSTLATSVTGTGWQLVTITLTPLTGSPENGTFEGVRIRTVPITVTNLQDLARYLKWAPSQSGNFDGSDDYVDYGDVTDLDGASSATWSFWVYQSSLDAGRVLHRMGGTGGGFRISTNASGNVEVIIRNGGTNASETTTGAPLSAGTWHHVAIVYTSSAVTIYVDGSSAASTTYSTLPATIAAPTPSGTLRVNDSGGSLSMAGYLCNLAFWAGTAASAAQVGEAYASGSPPDLNDLATLGDPTWWVPADGAWNPRNHASSPTASGGVGFVASVP